MTTFYLLKLRLSNFDPAAVKWDDAPGITNKGCPHLYGTNFGAADVVDVKQVFRNEGQTWTEALAEEGVKEWLV